MMTGRNHWGTRRRGLWINGTIAEEKENHGKAVKAGPMVLEKGHRLDARYASRLSTSHLNALGGMLNQELAQEKVDAGTVMRQATNENNVQNWVKPDGRVACDILVTKVSIQI